MLAMVTPSDTVALKEIKGMLADWQIRTVVCSEDDFLEFVASKFPAPGDSPGWSSEKYEKKATRQMISWLHLPYRIRNWGLLKQLRMLRLSYSVKRSFS